MSVGSSIGGSFTNAQYICHYNYDCTQDTANKIEVHYSIVSACVFAVALGVFFLGCTNRGALREKFQLPGDACTDCCMWFFCAPCALCQETRTLMDNNVEDGVWMGPDVMKVHKGSAVV